MSPPEEVGSIPALILIFTVLATIGFGLQGLFIFSNPTLLLALNIVFLTGTSVAVVIVSAKSYLIHGTSNVLFLGCAVLIGGLSAFAAGLAGLSSANNNNIIYNTGICFSGALQFLAALVTVFGIRSNLTLRKKVSLMLAFVLSIAFVGILSALAILGYIPAFLIGTDPTLLRQFVTASAVLFFALSSLTFGWQYLKTKSKVLLWYSLALSLFAIGLFSAFSVRHSGDLLTWLARTSVYAGGFYFLAAVLSLRRGAENIEIGVFQGWNEAFGSDRQQLSTLFSSMLEAFAYSRILLDKEGKPVDYIFLEVNATFEKMFGLPRERIIGKRATQIFPGIENDTADWIGRYGKVALTGQPTQFEAYSELLGKWFSVSAFSSRKEYFVLLTQETTKRRQAEKQLEEHAKNLEQVIEERTKQLRDSERLAAIGATAGMVGHDIRNPLQAITSDVFLAKSELTSLPESEEKKNTLGSIEEIEKSVDYINKIVQDLQDYARPLSPKIEENDLKVLVVNLLVKSHLPENISVNVKVDDAARTIRTDVYYLNRILYNLVTNSVQAMPNGGKLSIEAHKEEDETILTIKDTGGGIPKNSHEKMFTVMFTTKSKGQGFGLPVVKRMTESLGGSVSFESQEDKGTTFTIRLPPPKEQNGKLVYK